MPFKKQGLPRKHPLGPTNDRLQRQSLQANVPRRHSGRRWFYGWFQTVPRRNPWIGTNPALFASSTTDPRGISLFLLPDQEAHPLPTFSSLDVTHAFPGRGWLSGPSDPILPPRSCLFCHPFFFLFFFLALSHTWFSECRMNKALALPTSRRFLDPVRGCDPSLAHSRALAPIESDFAPFSKTTPCPNSVDTCHHGTRDVLPPTTHVG